MIVGLTQAQGEFVLPEVRPERVLLISGGSGITPVMAMLRTLCDEGFTGEVAPKPQNPKTPKPQILLLMDISSSSRKVSPIKRVPMVVDLISD